MLAGLLLGAEMCETAAGIHRARGAHLRRQGLPEDAHEQEAIADVLMGMATSLRLRADQEDTGEYVQVVDGGWIKIEPEDEAGSWWRRLMGLFT
jgi:uncharacterized protein YdbL (DUF1318 family)